MERVVDGGADDPNAELLIHAGQSKVPTADADCRNPFAGAAETSVDHF